MRKKRIITLLCLLALTIVWLSGHRITRFETLSLAPAGSDEDAHTLVAKMLRVNQPWLQPVSVSATYSFRRVVKRRSLREGSTTERESLGPFSAEPGCSAPRRVGSIVRTPLHAMVTGRSDYKVRMLGQTRLNGKPIIAVDVAFESPFQCKVGMGGQSNTTYSSSSYLVKDVRIWIDVEKAVPLFLTTSATVSTLSRPILSTWGFSGGFYELENGLAPRAFEWTDTAAFRERQEFQLVNGVWMFSKGRSTYRFPQPPSGVGYVGKLLDRFKISVYQTQELELTGFRLTTADTNSSPSGAANATPPHG